MRIVLNWNSGPYSEFYEENPDSPRRNYDAVVEVPPALWEEYTALGSRLIDLEMMIENSPRAHAR